MLVRERTTLKIGINRYIPSRLNSTVWLCFKKATIGIVIVSAVFMVIGCSLGLEVSSLGNNNRTPATDNNNLLPNDTEEQRGDSLSGGVENQVDSSPTGDIDNDNVLNALDVDDDNDGLIEIHDLVMLNAIRYDLDGTHYDDEADDGAGNEGTSSGCPASGCRGYELARSLDFTDSASYPNGVVNSAWLPNEENSGAGDNAGWEPIGAQSYFSAIFEGNGYAIRNLYVRASRLSGLFGVLANRGVIQNVQVLEANIYGDETAINNVAGVLVAMNLGAVVSARTSGNVYGQATTDTLGGLAGENEGKIIGSDANAQVYGNGRGDYVGGLVGDNLNEIIASFSFGSVHGGGGADYVGGLIGSNTGHVIVSYSQADTYGDEGDDMVGGLVGLNSSYIAATYTTGDNDGGSGENDIVGGLVGYNYGIINASYSTSTASNGAHVGALVGDNDSNPTSGIHSSYAFNTSVAILGDGSAGTTLPTGVVNPADLTGDSNTSTYAGASWSEKNSHTVNAWNFRSTREAPVLQYNDYDGTGTGANIYRCIDDTEEARHTIPNCGTALAMQ